MSARTISFIWDIVPADPSAELPSAKLEYTVLLVQKGSVVEHSIKRAYLSLQSRKDVPLVRSESVDDQLVFDLGEGSQLLGVEMLSPSFPRRPARFHAFMRARKAEAHDDLELFFRAPATIAKYWKPMGELLDVTLRSLFAIIGKVPVGTDLLEVVAQALQAGATPPVVGKRSAKRGSQPGLSEKSWAEEPEARQLMHVAV